MVSSILTSNYKVKTKILLALTWDSWVHLSLEVWLLLILIEKGHLITWTDLEFCEQIPSTILPIWYSKRLSLLICPVFLVQEIGLTIIVQDWTIWFLFKKTCEVIILILHWTLGIALISWKKILRHIAWKLRKNSVALNLMKLLCLISSDNRNLNHGPVLNINHLRIDRLVTILEFLIVCPFNTLFKISSFENLLRAHSTRAKFIWFIIIWSYNLKPFLRSDTSSSELYMKFDMRLIFPKSFEMLPVPDSFTRSTLPNMTKIFISRLLFFLVQGWK